MVAESRDTHAMNDGDGDEAKMSDVGELSKQVSHEFFGRK
jgi:hypothetical protein